MRVCGEHSPFRPPFGFRQFPYPPASKKYHFQFGETGIISKSQIMKETLLKVTKVEPIEDKNGVKGKKVTFVGINIIANRECQTEVIGTKNLWPDREVTIKATGEKTLIKGSPSFLTVEPGMFYDGHIYRCDTTPYDLNGRQVKSWKGVVFSSENPLVVAAQALRQNGAAPKFHNPETGLTDTFVLQSAPAAGVADPV